MPFAAPPTIVLISVAAALVAVAGAFVSILIALGARRALRRLVSKESAAMLNVHQFEQKLAAVSALAAQAVKHCAEKHANVESVLAEGQATFDRAADALDTLAATLGPLVPVQLPLVEAASEIVVQPDPIPAEG